MVHGIGIEKIRVIDQLVGLISQNSTDFIGWYVNKTQEQLKISRSNVYHQYLAYHQGHAGYASGRYKSSDALKAVASRTAENAQLFKQQLAKCN
ncbi:MAG: hypothetical protein ACJZ8I_02615 [Paracoccaceae bacterium]